MEMFAKAKLLLPLPAASLVLGSNLGPEPRSTYIYRAPQCMSPLWNWEVLDGFVWLGWFGWSDGLDGLDGLDGFDGFDGFDGLIGLDGWF